MAIATPDVIRTLAFGGISGSYATVGSALTHSWKAFRLVNATNGDIFFSIDGTNNNWFLPSNSFLLLDLSANAPPVGVNDSYQLPIGTQFYAKQSTAPTSGAVYIEGMYVRGQ